MEKKMETTIMGYIGYRIWGICGCQTRTRKKQEGVCASLKAQELEAPLAWRQTDEPRG